MPKAMLVLVTGVLLQIGGCVANAHYWERFLPEARFRRLNYLGCLLATLFIMGIPCWVAAAYGYLPVAVAGCLHIAGILLFLIGLFANSGKLVESSVPAVLVIWIVLFIIPGLQAAKQRAMQAREREQQASPATSDGH